jgi:serine/threonine protein kinase
MQSIHSKSEAFIADNVSTTIDTHLEAGSSREDSCLSELCRDTSTLARDASGLSDFSPEASSLMDSVAPTPVAQANLAAAGAQQTTTGGGGIQERMLEAGPCYSSEECTDFRSISSDLTTCSTLGQADLMQRWHERKAAKKNRRKSETQKPSYGNLAQASFNSSKKETDVDALAKDTGVRLFCHEQLGAGSFSRVYKGTWTKADKSVVSVAVKVIRQRWTNPELSSNVTPGTLPKCVEREARASCELDHENLVKVHVTQITKLPYLFVMDFCAGGNLHDLLHTQRLEPYDGEPVPTLPQLATFNWRQRQKVALDIANGMEYLHGQAFMHRDLKSHNVLLARPIRSHADEPVAKVCDFGLAKSFSEEVSTKSVGSWHYMAPEVFETEESGIFQHQGGKADVYSYAMILYELLTERKPFDQISGILLGPIVLSGRRPEVKLIPSDAPDVLQNLLVSCWAGDPLKRPSFGQASKDLTAALEMEASMNESAERQLGSVNHVATDEREAEPEGSSDNDCREATHEQENELQRSFDHDCIEEATDEREAEPWGCSDSANREAMEEQAAKPRPGDTNRFIAEVKHLIEVLLGSCQTHLSDLRTLLQRLKH